MALALSRRLSEAVKHGNPGDISRCESEWTNHRQIVIQWALKTAWRQAVAARQIPSLRAVVFDLKFQPDQEDILDALLDDPAEEVIGFFDREMGLNLTDKMACRMIQAGCPENVPLFLKEVTRPLFVSMLLLSPPNEKTMAKICEQHNGTICGFSFTETERALVAAHCEYLHLPATGTFLRDIFQVYQPLTAPPPLWRTFEYVLDHCGIEPLVPDEYFATLCREGDEMGVRFLIEKADYFPMDIGAYSDDIFSHASIARLVVHSFDIVDWMDDVENLSDEC
jgi:hypothetical protein